jgi:Flp pilus assembly protein TadD
MYQGHVDEALQLWAGVPALTDDGSLQYLAHMFTGRALAVSGRRPEAIAAYRRAEAIRPAAQSARIPLAALLYVTGARDEAARLVSPLLTAPAATPDPWWSYTDPHVSDRLDAMRRAVPK